MRLPSQAYQRLGFTHEEFEQAMMLVQQLGSNQAADQAMSLPPGTVAKWAKEWIRVQRETEHEQAQDQANQSAAVLDVQILEQHGTSRSSRSHDRQIKRTSRSSSAVVGSRIDEEFEDAEAALQAFRRGAELRTGRPVPVGSSAQAEPDPEDQEAPQQRQLALARLEEVAAGLRKLSEVSERAALTQSKASADEEIKAMLKLATTMMEFMGKQQNSHQEQLQSIQGRLRRIEDQQQQLISRSDPSIALITQLEELSRSINELSTEEQLIQVQDDVADLRDLIDETLRLAPRLQDVARELFRTELHDHSRSLGERLAALLRQHADAMIESDARMPGAIADLLAQEWEPSFTELGEVLEHSAKQVASNLLVMRQDIEKRDQELKQSIERRDQSLRSWFEQQFVVRNQSAQHQYREQKSQLEEIASGVSNVSGQIDGVRRLVDEYGSQTAQAEQIHSLHQEIARLQRVVEHLQEKSALRITL